LVDCITLWLSNLMLGGRDVDASVVALELALKRRKAPTIVVSNEVGLGIVPDTPLGRDFRDKAGVLNQRLASLADRVIFMVAGQPMTVKGSP
jgi:adenosyl cobinamide kinase/adenosyl cobinamide phosphate guanylyltransferase